MNCNEIIAVKINQQNCERKYGYDCGVESQTMNECMDVLISNLA